MGNVLRNNFELCARDILVLSANLVNNRGRELSQLNISFGGDAMRTQAHFKSLSFGEGAVFNPLCAGENSRLIIKEVSGSFRGNDGEFRGEMNIDVPADKMARLLLTALNPSCGRLSPRAIRILEPFSLKQISLTYSDKFCTGKRGQTRPGVIIKNNSGMKIYDVSINHRPIGQNTMPVSLPCLNAGEEAKRLFDMNLTAPPCPQTIRLKLADGIEFAGKFESEILKLPMGTALQPKPMGPNKTLPMLIR